MAGMIGPLSQVEGQVVGLNTQLARMIKLQNGIDAKGFKAMSRAGTAASQTYREALASTGMFEVQQVKVNKATDDYIKKLNKQKLSFSEMAKSQKVAAAAYKEQLAMMQGMTVLQNRAGTTGNRMVLDVGIPREVSSEMDTVGRRLSFLNQQLKSGATQLINWGKNAQWSGRQLSMGFTMPLAAVGAAAATMYYQVDKELTRVTKVYNTTADQNSTAIKDQIAVQQELDTVRKQGTATAVAAAKEFGVAMKDTLSVQADLAATGEKGQKLQDATTAVVRNAMLGEIDYNTATTATIALQQQLHLSSSQLADTWNYMNSVENATSLSMADFAKAIPIALGPLRQMGGTVQDLGTLLTGMVSRGIQVGKAANAIKAAAQRLLRPSKQIREEFAALTGADITEIATKNKGNLMGMLQDIYSVTKNLSQLSRGKVLAGLFGSYQLSTMSAMVDSMGDLDKGIGQVSEAFQVGQQDATQWATVADKEISQMQNSASGKFKRTVESIKANLVEMGKPFLEIGTMILKFVNNIIEWFNQLPSAAKIGIGALAGFIALLGPVVMLAGLIGNFTGNVIKLATVLAGKLLPKMELLDSEARAAAIAAQMMNDGLVQGIPVAEKLAQEMKVVAASIEAARLAGLDYAASQGLVAGAGTAGGTGATGAQTTAQQALNRAVLQEGSFQAAIAKTLAEINRLQAQRALLLADATGLTEDELLAREAQIEQLSAQIGQHRTLLVMLEQENSLTQAATTERERQLLAMQQQGQSQRRLTALSVANGASMALITASMITMMSTSNTTAHHWANIGLSLGIAMPLVGQLGKGISSVAGKLATATGRSTGLLAALGSSATTAGLIGVGIAGAGVAAYAVWKHFHDQNVEADKLRAKLADETREMSSQKSILEQQLGIRLKQQKAASDISKMNVVDSNLPDALQVAELGQRFAKDSDMKGQIDLISSDQTTALTKQTALMHVYQQVIEATNGNAQLAEKSIAAMYAAAGDDANVAIGKAQQLVDTLNQLQSTGTLQTQLWTNDLIAGTQNRGNGDIMKFGGSDTYVYGDAAKQGSQFADQWWTAFATASDSEKKDLQADLQTTISGMWTSAFQKAQTDDRVNAQIKQLGITNGEQYRKAIEIYRRALAGKYGTGGDSDTGANSALNDALKGAGLNTVSNPFNTLGITSDDGNLSATGWGLAQGDQAQAAYDTEKAFVREMQKHLAIAGKLYNIDELRQKAMYQLLTVNKNNAKQVLDQLNADYAAQKQQEAADNAKAAGIDKNSKSYKQIVAQAGKLNDKEKLTNLNLVREQLGLSKATDLSQGLSDSAADTADNTKKAADAINKLPTALSINLSFNQADIANVYKSGMEGVQQDIADDMTDAQDAAFDKQTTAQTNAFQNQTDAQNDAFQRQTDAQQRQFDKQTKAQETYWDNLKNKADKYWDGRISKVNAEIKAEQKADEQRQKMFEAEIARIEKLNDMANKNIDFNTAISQGNFDEAAKIRNDQEAANTTSLIQAAEDKASTASQNRQDRLQTRADALSKQKDAYIDNLEKEEQAAKDSLKRRQDNEEKALKKRQQIEERALKRRQDAEQRSLKATQDAEKKSLKQRLDLFLAYIATNQKDLRRHMKAVGISYDSFENTVIKPKSTTWANYFGDKLKRHMRQTALGLASDKVWEVLGKSSRKAILDAMGFKNLQQFNHFVLTGSMTGWKKKNTATTAIPNNKPVPSGTRGAIGGNFETRHEGGTIGSGGGSRKGIARTQKGLHPSEVMVRARKGEFMVNHKDAENNRNILEAINNGEYPGGVMGGASPAEGIPGLVTGIMSRMFIQGIKTGMANGVSQVMANQAASVGSFGSVKAGRYGDITFSADQLKNARIIANVGKSMGMSARDIEIGIMTSITESSLRNINFGDRDSLGLFQQRPSQGWGTPAQVTDPEYAARKFFSTLQGVKNRAGMDPWLAAQAVQRSAYSDGSNYRKYWNEATAIYTALGKVAVDTDAYVPGKGGRHRPINSAPTSGIHDEYTGYPALDFATPVGTPIYAVSDGVITRSYDIRGNEPRRAQYGKSQDGYRSYGRVIYLKTDAGPEVLYAHLSKRGVTQGQHVKGGSIIGRTGDTGNSTGPHLHFGSKGTSPYTWVNAKSSNGEVLGGYGQLGTQFTDLGSKPTSSAATGSTSSVNSGKGGNVGIGTYNVKYSSNNAGTKQDLSGLMKQTDILNLEEFTGNKKKLIPWMKSAGWNVFGEGESVIAWNTNKYKFLDGSTFDLNQGKGGSSGGRKQFLGNVAHLQNRATGQSLYQIVAHTALRENKEMQLRQYAAIANKVNQLEKSGQPVFVSGDLNSDPRNGRVGKIGLNSNWANGRMNNAAPTIGHSYFDYNLYGSLAKLLSQKVIKGTSDHKAVLSQFAIPSLAKGAENIKWDNTLANLHKNETVLTADLSEKFKRGVTNFANGGNATYNVYVTHQNPTASPDEIANKAVIKLKREQQRLAGNRR